MSTPIGRLRVAGLVEGASYLLLLGVAMPLKHLAGIPGPVKVVGWIHGVLFMIFCAALAQAMFAARWSTRKAAGVFIAALLPFGTFAIDRRLRRDDELLRAREGGAPAS